MAEREGMSHTIMRLQFIEYLVEQLCREREETRSLHLRRVGAICGDVDKRGPVRAAMPQGGARH